MVRILKDYDERLKEFLNTAQELFFRKGYDKTSVEDIIQKVGVAKGTFYYYFKSKEDLLDKLVARFVDQTLIKTQEVVNKNLNALNKLKEFFITIRNFKIFNMKLMKIFIRVFTKDENLTLRHKILQRSNELIIPEFNKIIKQGIEEGVFRTKYPDQIGELIFILGDGVNYNITKQIADLDNHPEYMGIINSKVLAYENTIEKMLGIPEGSLNMYDKKLIKKFK